MSLVRLNNLKMAYGGQDIFDSLTSQINKGDHIGLVGPNGAGKTTLLRLLIGQLQPLDGSINKLPELPIGYLMQNPEYPGGQTAFDEVYEGLGEIKLVESRMKELEPKIEKAQNDNQKEAEKLGMKYAELTDRYQMLGGPAAEARIAALLDGLGVPRRIWRSDMESLSGGERNMVGLARILIGKHDLMLLDEPGNHLDFSGLEWLEHFLKTSDKAFIIVSHNRYTLDRVCTKIWELERGKLNLYTGNYSDYRAEKLTKQLVQEAAYHRAQKEIDRLQFNIQRMKAWSSVYDNPKLAKTAKIFEKRVEDLKEVDKPRGDGKKMHLRFLTKPPRGHIALDVKEYRIQFDDSPPLLENVNFLITQGERAAMVGDNGTGKSTFLKEVIDRGRWENQILRVGKSVTVGYYAQLGENLEPKRTVIENAMRLTGLLRGSAADLLHRFLFTRDDLEKYVQVLSGGEKARLQLATLVTSGADMLLLDEPTNHLDIASREAVEDALEEFPGTIVVVSHDRYFLDKIADRIFHFVPPDVSEYEGNFSEFWTKHKKLYSVKVSKSAHALPKRTVHGQDKSKPKPKQKRFKFDAIRFRELEVEIKRLEDLRPEIETEYNTLTEKGKTARAEKRRIRIEKLDAELEGLYEEWLLLGEKKKKW